MTPATRPLVQRTLVLTAGPLAQAAGRRLEASLQERPSPAAAMAVVDYLSEEAQSWETAVTTALTRISPPDLAASLAQAGWRLADPPEIVVLLLLDVAAACEAPGSGSLPHTLLHEAAALVYAHLGLETMPLLIWLAGEVSPQELLDCLQTRLPLGHLPLALSLRNELGLRLPTPAALVEAAADLLWLLTATPLRDLPDWLTGPQGAAYSEKAAYGTIGLHHWRWSPAATLARFRSCWLEAVLAHWLARAPEPADAAQVAAWLENQQLSPAGLAPYALTPEEQALPTFQAADWAMPRPWQIRRLLAEMQLDEAADEALQTERVQQAGLRMDEPLQRAARLLRAQAMTLLDRQPVAGVSRTCTWLQEAAAVCGQMVEQLLDQQEAQQVSASRLAAERGVLQAQLKSWLESWPEPAWRGWRRVALRPWRWPYYLWRYWQLRQAGRQLSQIYMRQAARRRQEAIQTATRQAVSELERIAWRVNGQVEEVGDMLAALAQALAQDAPCLRQPSDAADGISSEEGWLPTPWRLYPRLVPDPAQEAVVAAAAAGGLGQQVQQLDDEGLLAALSRYSAERLAAVNTLTTSDVLLATLPEGMSLEAIWQNGWDAASPLWRYDETRLAESARGGHRQHAFVCGGGATALADFLGTAANDVTWIEGGDRERLFVVRARTGLTPPALAAAWSGVTEEKELEP